MRHNNGVGFKMFFAVILIGLAYAGLTGQLTGWLDGMKATATATKPIE